MSVCSVETYATVATRASIASYVSGRSCGAATRPVETQRVVSGAVDEFPNFFQYQTHFRCPSEDGSEIDLEETESRRCVQAGVPGPADEYDRRVDRSLRKRIRYLESLLDQNHSLQDLLSLNRQQLSSKGFSEEQYEDLEKYTLSHLERLESSKLLRENILAGSEEAGRAGDSLTTAALGALSLQNDSQENRPPSMLERWLRAPDESGVWKDLPRSVLSGVLLSHDFQAVVEEGSASPMIFRRKDDNLSLPDCTLGPVLSESSSAGYDSIKPWQPIDFHSEPKTYFRAVTRSFRGSHVARKQRIDSAVQRFMGIFEQWLDLTLTKYCSAANGGSSQPSSHRIGGARHSPQDKGQRSSLKRRRGEESDGSGEGGGDDDGRPAKRARRTSNKGTVQPKKLACPYFKRHPEEYYRLHKGTACVGDGWPLFHRVREHLYRRHSLSHRCPRCHAKFQNDEDLLEHQAAPNTCHSRCQKPRDGFGSDVERKIKTYKPKRNQPESQKWIDIYKVLFPDDDPESVPSPYFDDDLLESLRTKSTTHGNLSNNQYANYLRQELPSIFRPLLEQIFEEEVASMNEKIQLRVVAAVDDAQQIAYRRFVEENSEHDRAGLVGHRRKSGSADTNSPGSNDDAAGLFGESSQAAEEAGGMDDVAIANDDNVLEGHIVGSDIPMQLAEEIVVAPSKMALPLDNADLQPDLPPWVSSHRDHLQALSSCGFDPDMMEEPPGLADSLLHPLDPPYMFEFGPENVFWPEFSTGDGS